MKNLQIYPTVTYVETVEVTLPETFQGSVIFLPFSTVLNNCKITGICFNQAGGLYPANTVYVESIGAKQLNLNLVQEDDTMVVENLPLSCLLSLNASQNRTWRRFSTRIFAAKCYLYINDTTNYNIYFANKRVSLSFYYKPLNY
jgi:hypothetical protein